MWGEVPKYQALVVQEQIRKEREAFENKRKMVRKTLDEQVDAFNKVRANQKQKDKDMDKMILERAQQEIQQDKAKKEALVKKTLDAKQVMEQQVQLAQKRKTDNFAQQRNKEIEEMKKL
jgi:hypothetical protein